MKKDILTISAVKGDLIKLQKQKEGVMCEWRFSYIVPLTLLAVLLGFLLKSILIPALISIPIIYHLVRYILSKRAHNRAVRSVKGVRDRRDILISREVLTHAEEETVYEPHIVARARRVRNVSLREAYVLYFKSGLRWRIPTLPLHYDWSREYYTTTQGMMNIAVEGNEYYCISLREDPDVAYLYPLKFFELDEELAILAGEY